MLTHCQNIKDVPMLSISNPKTVKNLNSPFLVLYPDKKGRRVDYQTIARVSWLLLIDRNELGAFLLPNLYV